MVQGDVLERPMIELVSCPHCRWSVLATGGGNGARLQAALREHNRLRHGAAPVSSH